MTWTVGTFNVNGIRARLGLVTAWLAESGLDLLCLQEIKCQDPDFPAGAFADLGYQAAWWGQKSYNGVALIYKTEPDEVVRGLGDGAEDPEQSRFIAARFGRRWVVNTYIPQGREVGDPAFAYKLEYYARLKRWLGERLAPDTPLLWVGDFNVAPDDLDLYDPQRLAGSVGCHPDERAALAQVKDWGFTDCFRRHHPEDRQFTFWDYRLPKSFQRDLGWRLDFVMATEPLAQACKDCWVDTAPRGLPKPSDHTPVLARFAV